MLFNSAAFIFVFLPATILLFFAVARLSCTLALSFLAIASFVFYAQTDSKFLLILLPSIAVNFAIGSALVYDEASPRQRRAVVTFGVVLNLACLFTFKYLDFFVDTIDRVGFADISLPNIELPLGISFFTFTQIAFLVDAYQRKVHETRFETYALFVSYFPHLIAGPIIHHAEMIPQFTARSTFRAHAENFAVGSSVFFIGLFKKAVLADTLAPYVHRVFDAAGQGVGLSFVEAWSGALLYALQIYLDFSGYSDMAIGLSLLFGIKLPLNFNSPYKAVNIIDFWRRWHMTLSRFLRDYLYIPLGGNRTGELRRLANIMIVMLLGGLWHGASWTFVVWGALHGCYLVVNHAWHAAIAKMRIPIVIPDAAGCGLTVLLVTVAWVFFRSPTLQAAFSMVQSMFGWQTATSVDRVILAPPLILALAGVLFVGGWLVPNTQEIMSLYKPALDSPIAEIFRWRKMLLWRPNPVCAVSIAALAVASLATIVYVKRVGDFIYFQF